MAGRRTTLNDLAKSLGLSVNTVSRALTGKDGVSQRTRELVLEEAERTGYRAASRPVEEFRDIALVVTSATNVFISQLITAIESACRAADYSVVLHISEESAKQEERIIEAMLASEHAGAIVIPVQGDGDPWRRVQAQMPIVTVAREIPGRDCDVVGVDARSAVYAATRHLLAAGAKSLLMFEEQRDNSTVTGRLRGFEEAMSEEPTAIGHVARIPTRHFESSIAPWQAEEAYRRFLEVLEEGTDFDAILVADDYYALGVMRALQERGLSVPDDVLLMGYGNHAYSGFLTPALSTVGLPTALIGEIAVSMLLQRINGHAGPTRHRLVKTELVLRDSTVPSTRNGTRLAIAGGAGKV